MLTSHGSSKPINIAERHTNAGTGFTAADLTALGQVQAAPRHLWGRDQLIANEFAHHLAVWRPEAGIADPPASALARFKNTGTYMMIGTTVVATGKRLSDVLPALRCYGTRGDRSTP